MAPLGPFYATLHRVDVLLFCFELGGLSSASSAAQRIQRMRPFGPFCATLHRVVVLLFYFGLVSLLCVSPTKQRAQRMTPCGPFYATPAQRRRATILMWIGAAVVCPFDQTAHPTNGSLRTILRDAAQRRRAIILI
jgi:hypothetical protein